MVSEEWPAAEQPDCPDPLAEQGPVSGTGPIELSTDDQEAKPGERLGVYVCHCGGNISDYVDVDEVAEVVGREEGVTISRHVTFMCSDEGQEKITEDIKEMNLDRVIVAACTPSLHETTFRKAVVRADMNPYLYLPANIREQVSWAHPHDTEAATDKAIAVVRAAVAKSRLLEPLATVRVDAVHRILVIGAGVAGLRAALDSAAMGQAVTLIEASPFLGGRSMMLGTVYPTDEAAVPLVRRLIDEVMADDRIEVRTNTRVTALSGFLGDFSVTLRTAPRGVGPELSEEGATAAMAACPIEIDDEFQQGLVKRKAFYKPIPESVPELPAIDWANCTRCGECVLAGGKGIQIDGVPEDEVVAAGAIIVASGYDHYEPAEGEYGYKQSERVVTLPQLERMLDPEGPTGGELLIEGKTPRSIAFIHCVGSRQIAGVDEPKPDATLNEYCSRVCCTATLQATNEVRRRLPETTVYDLYRDIRTYQKEQERYYVDASKLGVRFLRFDNETRPEVSVTQSGDDYPLTVKVTDTLTFGAELEVPADLVVLGVGMEPRDISDIIDMTKLPVGDDDFLLEVHPKLRPVESAIPGIYLAGAAQSPRDITESTSSASAAAVKAATVLAKDYVEMEPFVARVDLSKCTGAAACVEACQYDGAISMTEVEVEEGVFASKAYVNPVACVGCGACVAVCASEAIDVQGWEMDQYRAMIDALTSAPPDEVPAVEVPA
ncbi:MAG: CoB--CoM heterodisulfide reductase iron-sulfur subunit A family protein [Chloroflexota bacterium]|nr:CoB--CoM heterodisulfide reductase iron-sulfur subunit A family protein [Chloroflexota bacterium]